MSHPTCSRDFDGAPVDCRPVDGPRILKSGDRVIVRDRGNRGAWSHYMLPTIGMEGVVDYVMGSGVYVVVSVAHGGPWAYHWSNLDHAP